MRDGEAGPLACICRRLGLHHPTFAVTILQFGSCLMNTTFQFYYVKVFLNHYKISEAWFQLAQILFMIWNSINDPLFGFFQIVPVLNALDSFKNRLPFLFAILIISIVMLFMMYLFWITNKLVDIGGSWMRSRTKSILFGAPFYSLFFLLFWFPWGGPESPPWVIGLHLIVALFLYDAVFSFSLLAWCALFAEVTTDPAGRVRVIKYTQFAVLMGVNVILVLEKVSHSLENFWAFQVSGFVIAMIGFVCVSYTGLYAPTNVAQINTSSPSKSDEPSEEIGWTMRKSLSVAKEVLAAPDFRRMTATNFLHICRSTCHLNFASIFCEGLIPRSVFPLGSWEISLFYGVCAALPQILMITNSGLVLKHGSYSLLMKSFVSSVVLSIVTFCIGRHYPAIVIIYMIIDSIQVHSFSPLLNILFPDFIDDDMSRNNRNSPVSSIVFSLNALFTKPAQSLAPMVVVYFLNLYGYEDYKDKSKWMTEAEISRLRDCMFTLLTVSSALLAALQYQLLKRYTLRDKHLPSDDIERAEVFAESLASGF